MELRRMFRFRNMWIGVAMLWIMFFHSGVWLESEYLLTLKNIGYGGVDICLFASGIGCYYSLEKDPDLLRFLRRRVKRLGPVYGCFIVPWLLWRSSVSALPARAILGNLLGIQTLVSWEYHFNWYIGGLVVYYLSIPYLKRITDSCGNLLQDTVVAAALFLSTIPFWESGNAIVILSRMPVLYTGLVFAKMAKRGYILKKRDYFTAGSIAVMGTILLLFFRKACPDFLWSRGLYWYPFALMVPGGCIFLSLLAEWLDKHKMLHWVRCFLDTVGIYSFELYLVHVFLYEGLMPKIMERLYRIPNNLLWLATLPVVVLCTWLLNRAGVCVEHILKSIVKKHDR